MKIQLTKINKVENARFPTPDKCDYIPGIDNRNVSLPIDYEIIGHIDSIPVVGDIISGIRTHRNGEEVPGYFETSKITEMTELDDNTFTFNTQNSIYKLVVL